MWIDKKELSEYKDEIEELHKKVASLMKTNTELLEDDIVVKEQREELTKMLADVNEERKKIPQKFTIIREPEREESGDYTFAYYENISTILKNRFFQWFLYQFREKIISQVAHNIGTENKFFLVNKEEVAGGIKTIDQLMVEMENIKYYYDTIIEAENSGKENNS